MAFLLFISISSSKSWTTYLHSRTVNAGKYGVQVNFMEKLSAGHIIFVV